MPAIAEALHSAPLQLTCLVGGHLSTGYPGGRIVGGDVFTARSGSAHFPHKSNAVQSYYHLTRMDLSISHQSRTSRPTGDGDHSMKNLILAAFAALSLTAAVVPVANAHSTIAGDAQATQMQQTGAYSG
jgi:hypothetical protein